MFTYISLITSLRTPVAQALLKASFHLSFLLLLHLNGVRINYAASVFGPFGSDLGVDWELPGSCPKSGVVFGARGGPHNPDIQHVLGSVLGSPYLERLQLETNLAS